MNADPYDWTADPGQARGARPPVPAPKPKRATPERDLQRTLIRWLRAALPLGAFAFAIPNEQRGDAVSDVQRMRFGAARKASGVVSGMPDVGLVLHGGRVAWLELKAPKGRTSDMQDGLHARLDALGHQVAVIRSIDEAEAVLRAWGVPLRVRG